MVIWIIGMSGAGKTTVALDVVESIRKTGKDVVLLDGDAVRDLLDNDVDHSIDGRRKNAERISKFTSFLDKQGINVVVSVLSIFPDLRVWNRQNIERYYEVYIKVSLENLIERDIKNLYKPAINGEIKNVVGVDIEFPEPKDADLIIDNNLYTSDFRNIVKQIINLSRVEQ